MSAPLNGTGMGQLQLRAARLRAAAEARQRNSTAPIEQPPESSPEYQGVGPVGQGEYIVGAGECISSIAAKMGYLWETIWNDAANSALKLARKNPNALLAGDRVVLPAKKTKQGSGQTEMRHRFVRHGEPTWLNLKLLDTAGEPRRNLKYTLVIDGNKRAGMTDGDGKLRERIPGNAQLAVLRLDVEPKEEYRLNLGAIDPAREVTGIQARLNNLSYGCGDVDGIMGPQTLAALNRFRADVGLPTSSAVDDATLAKLEQVHDQMQSTPQSKATTAPNNPPPCDENMCLRDAA